MSYKIVLKGGIGDLYVSNNRGMLLAMKWKSNELVGKIDVDGTVVEASAIRAIIPNAPDPDSSEKKDAWMEMMRREEKKFQEYKTRRLAMAPKDRAQDTRFMNYICYGLRGRTLTEEEKKEVQIAQEKWFTEHPDFHLANPICYFSEIDVRRASAGSGQRIGEVQSITDMRAGIVLSHAERFLQA